MARVPKKLTELDGLIHLDDRVLLYRTTQTTEEVSYIEGRSFTHTLNSYYFKYNDIEFTPPGRLISNDFKNSVIRNISTRNH